MKNSYSFIQYITFPTLMLLLMWIVFLFEIDYGYNLNEYGIYPRTFSGLKGIIFSPFIHGDLEHLANNSIAFFVLTMLLRYFFDKNYLRIFVYGMLISGFLTWLFARPAYHIGMSGVIYLLVSFIFSSGIISKNYRLIALSLFIVFSYGSMIWYVIPIEASISWEGHLTGLLVGVLFSFFYKHEIIYEENVKVVSDQQSLFLDHFNDEGRFIENLPFLDKNGNLIIEDEEE